MKTKPYAGGSFRLRTKTDTQTMKVKNSVWLNADKSKALPPGHKDAAFQLVGAGGHVSKETAEKYGITESGVAGTPKGAGLPRVPHMVTVNTPDGVNTAPGTPANTVSTPVAITAIETAAPVATPVADQPPTETAANTPAAHASEPGKPSAAPSKGRKPADPLKALQRKKGNAK